MKTTVEISDPLFDAAKREAERAGCTLRDLIESGLRAELDRRTRQVKGYVIPDKSVGGGWLEPGLRTDGRALAAYARMGLPGHPETVEQVHAMLDAEAGGGTDDFERGRRK